MTGLKEAEPDKYSMINFEETELRLGLPGASSSAESELKTTWCAGGKRGFSDTSVDLKLNLSSNTTPTHNTTTAASTSNDPSKPPANRAQVVGWPPVRSSRKNIGTAHQSQQKKEEEEGGAFVKVSMDGAPYLRKVDLKQYKSYQELSQGLAKMFSSFTNTDATPQAATKDFLNESKLIDLLTGSDYVPTYEDKDADWMLVGDVPWEMFVESCKRIRIMKGSDAIGLAPRAVEKCKNRS